MANIFICVRYPFFGKRRSYTLEQAGRITLVEFPETADREVSQLFALLERWHDLRSEVLYFPWSVSDRKPRTALSFSDLFRDVVNCFLVYVRCVTPTRWPYVRTYMGLYGSCLPIRKFMFACVRACLRVLQGIRASFWTYPTRACVRACVLCEPTIYIARPSR
jgi:hypothetical protein